MCGFIAVFADDSRVSLELLDRGLQVMRYRGPDAQKSWVCPNRRVGMGHARLAIIDLHTGDQPLFNEDESIVAIVNGELYDFERIRQELTERGHQFKTKSDSEILIHLYEEYGTDCVEHLRGEFAFVLWDRRCDYVFAARDRKGSKPLFYARHDGMLVFASEAKALFEIGVPARWNSKRIYDTAMYHTMFNLTTAVGEDTLFEGIYQVPPAHRVFTPANGDVRPQPYWNYDYLTEEEERNSTMRMEEAVAIVEHELLEAVRLRLRADVEVGCYLSAGIDSTGALALASAVHNKPVTAFTMTFSESAYDEGPDAIEVAKALGCPYQPIEVGLRQMADVFDECIWHSESYLWNTNVMAKYLLSKGVRAAGYKVVLSGQGSDEIFAGYDSFKSDLEGKASSDSHLPQHIRDSMGRVEKVLGHVPTFLRAATRSTATTSKLLDRSFGEQHAGRDANWIWLSSLPLGKALQWPKVSRSMYLWNKSPLADYLLSCVGDRPEMANSVESRIPYLDHKLIEAVGRIPTRLKIHEGIEKAVLREALRGRLPEVARARAKKPFFAPPVSLDPQSALYERVRDALSGPLPPFFDRKRVQEFADNLPRIERGRFLRYTSEEERKILEADLCLMFVASTAQLGTRFGLT